MNKRERTLIALTGVALAFFATNKFLCAKKLTPAVPKNSAAAQAAPRSTSLAPAKVIEAVQETVETSPRRSVSPLLVTQWGRDPFAGYESIVKYDSTKQTENPVEQKPLLQLKAIAQKGDVFYALINDEVLREGESKGGIQVVRIEKDRVICRYQGQVMTLLLHKKDDL